MPKRFLNFTPLKEKKTTLSDLTQGLSAADLGELTNSMVDAILELVADCRDEDVAFVPADPNAHDPYAASADEIELSWTLGHVIAHTTASAEEAAFLAAELARGVPNHGRSRCEVDWRTITTIAQCRQRLEESRRMRLASIEMWPDEPHLDLRHTPYPTAGPRNALDVFAGGLKHDDDHLEQIAEIVRQTQNS